jgi:hypothetical protein
MLCSGDEADRAAALVPPETCLQEFPRAIVATRDSVLFKRVSVVPLAGHLVEALRVTEVLRGTGQQVDLQGLFGRAAS